MKIDWSTVGAFQYWGGIGRDQVLALLKARRGEALTGEEASALARWADDLYRSYVRDPNEINEDTCRTVSDYIQMTYINMDDDAS